MATKDYTYPHVNITTRALQRRTPVVAESTATTLLAPFTCDRGPENVLVPIDTMADFVSTFGELDYSIPDQRQILNIGRWIAGGGRVLACRITDYELVKEMVKESQNSNKYVETGNFIPKDGTKARKATGSTRKLYKESGADRLGYEVKITAKYSGKYYNDMIIKFELQNNGTYDITVVKDGLAIERFRNKHAEDFYTIESTSQYIGDIVISKYKEVIETSGSGNSATQTTSIVYLDIDVDNFDSAKNFEIGKIKLAGGDNVDDDILFGYHPASDSAEAVDVVSINDAIGHELYEALARGTKETIEVNDTTVIYVDGGKITYIGVLSGNTFIKHSVKKIYTIGKDSDGQATESELATIPDRSAFYIRYITTEAVSTNDYVSELAKRLRVILKQPLETPFDVMLDCGYPISVKKALRSLFTEDEGDLPQRHDAFLYLSDCTIFGNGRRNRSALDLIANQNSELSPISDGDNVAVITHYTKVKDIYSAESGKEVFVPTTYYLAYSIPYYDRVDGPQWPVAGQTRGVINNALWIDHIPANKEKQDYYDAHVNYIEKDSRGMYIMSQLTNTSQDTALKFINNSRALLKIKKELTLIARRYLHEFNDRITKTNIYNALNSYLANWIQNRTLSFGVIGLYDYTQNEALTNEELLITLDVKFTGTIEVISLEITVE